MIPPISNSLINEALAGMLQKYFPQCDVYDNPNQQNTKLPAWFIQYVPDSSITKEINNRYIRTFEIDLVYLVEYNVPDLYDQYREAAETLDEVMGMFQYIYENNAFFIHTFNRNWRIDLDALHYRLKLKIRASLQQTDNPVMETIEDINESVKGD